MKLSAKDGNKPLFKVAAHDSTKIEKMLKALAVMIVDKMF